MTILNPIDRSNLVPAGSPRRSPELRALGLALMALLLMLAATKSQALELAVKYDIDMYAYKTVEVGDSLNFAVYSDESCTSLLHSESVTAGSSRMLVEKVKQRKTTGMTEKPEKLLRLRTSVHPPAVADQVFLQVTASGIEPASGDDCQPQTVAGTGPQGPPGPPGADGVGSGGGGFAGCRTQVSVDDYPAGQNTPFEGVAFCGADQIAISGGCEDTTNSLKLREFGVEPGIEPTFFQCTFTRTNNINQVQVVTQALCCPL